MGKLTFVIFFVSSFPQNKHVQLSIFKKFVKLARGSHVWFGPACVMNEWPNWPCTPCNIMCFSHSHEIILYGGWAPMQQVILAYAVWLNSNHWHWCMVCLLCRMTIRNLAHITNVLKHITTEINARQTHQQISLINDNAVESVDLLLQVKIPLYQDPQNCAFYLTSPWSRRNLAAIFHFLLSLLMT